MLAIMVADAVKQPLERDLPVDVVDCSPPPCLGRHILKLCHQLLTQLTEMLKRASRILAPVISLNRPEFVVVGRQARGVLLNDGGHSFQVDLLPVTQMRQDLYHPPATVPRGAHEGVRRTLLKHPSKLQRHSAQLGHNLFWGPRGHVYHRVGTLRIAQGIQQGVAELGSPGGCQGRAASAIHNVTDRAARARMWLNGTGRSG